MELSHFDKDGNAVMVDVGQKQNSDRIAIASGSIYMNRECFDTVKQGKVQKGDVLNVARIAGIMGAKRCSELIPLCHNISLTNLSIDFEMVDEECKIKALCTAKTIGKTGVEMEALTAVQIGLLTVYDMLKAIDRGMVISDIRLLEKKGGKSGIWRAG